MELNINEQKVLNALDGKDLTGYQILKEVDTVFLLGEIYSLCNSLESKGYVSHYFKEHVKYYHLIPDNYIPSVHGLSFG
jgi:DNA-binding PadR family transcriptional regulator